ncbi:ABC transporter permease [Vibrio parahaemolyticus]|uniref:ABC transporter permease n=1 Tax=Vibrio parahaemolyticus TaxID=670 RepID=UPI00111E9E5E|nr:ABC transporter permease [Vibrio parahaemolyticus]EGR3114621.1 ABC transporter permease [Vibrio parahaemolyticus]EJG1643152.1 ABC transporter permease [Vibrio parahaemolyticus]ELB2087488.1 ABC transporter permease [Vibrio parahaemolyticus]ELP2671338.1 ABC transporter permease [Vibrio parahaemolyticus]MBC8656073.1 ABC transporter permease [Vibrio parahaemolyticus]
MIKLLLNRLAQAGFVAWAVGTLTFLMMRFLPGDMAYKIAAERYGYDYVNQEAAEVVRAELGLDRSGLEQYWSWLVDLVQLNLGQSLVSGEEVSSMIGHYLSYTFMLAATALVISLVIAFPLGIHSGKYPNKIIDKFAVGFSVLFRSTPVFLLGLILMIIFGYQLGWLPVTGFGEPQHIIMPSIALALTLAALSNQMIRNEAHSVFRAPFMRFARYKGLSDKQAEQHHLTPNVTLPVITFLGVQAISLIEGIVMIESLFAWPGIGHALSHAIFARDIPVIQAAALVMGLLFVGINTVIDLCQYALDPRVRQEKLAQ